MKDVMLQMAKILLLGLFVILVWGIFHGSRRRVDFAVLRSEVQEVFGTSGMKEGDAQLLRRLYGVNGGELANWYLLTAEDNMAVEELLLVECASSEQAGQVRLAAEKRAEPQKNNFEGYGPEQVQLLDNCVIQEEDPYVLFVVSERAQEVKTAFLKGL